MKHTVMVPFSFAELFRGRDAIESVMRREVVGDVEQLMDISLTDPQVQTLDYRFSEETTHGGEQIYVKVITEISAKELEDWTDIYTRKY